MENWFTQADNPEEAGVSCLLVSPAAESHAERLEQMEILRTRLWPQP